MYNIGPLDSLRRLTQRLTREGSYWISRVTRLARGGRSRPQMPDMDNFKGSPALLIGVIGCLFLCLCLVVVVAVIAILWIVPQGGSF